jgi:hypothetical protein
MIDNFKALYQDDRIYGKIEMSYDIIKGLKAVGRLGGDFSSQRTENKKAKLEYSDGLIVSKVVKLKKEVIIQNIIIIVLRLILLVF